MSPPVKRSIIGVSDIAGEGCVHPNIRLCVIQRGRLGETGDGVLGSDIGAAPGDPAVSGTPMRLTKRRSQVSRTFMAQQGHAHLSEEELKKLYVQFLEWNRRVKN